MTIYDDNYNRFLTDEEIRGIIAYWQGKNDPLMATIYELLLSDSEDD